jgi:hypothetical protein
MRDPHRIIQQLLMLAASQFFDLFSVAAVETTISFVPSWS